MSVLTENSFERLSDPVVGEAETFTLRILRRLKQLARILIADPGSRINMGSELANVRSLQEDFFAETDRWIIEAIPSAYMRGVEDVNGQIKELGIEGEIQDIRFGHEGIFVPPGITAQMATGGGGGSIPPSVRRRFGGYPRHLTMYEVFEASAHREFRRSQIPVIRDVEGKIRELTIQASRQQYTQADTFTRRQLSQELMEQFAKDNITGIRYSDGRTMKLDTYSEMVARTQTGNAARQAQLNRMREVGLDLVQVSVHWPCSDLCIPYQGRVYSQRGTSDQYPPLESTNPGSELYHANCKHSASAYVPGTSPGRKEERNQFSRKENERRYELTQKQRYNERQVRYWKRRRETALTDDELKKAKSKVSQWQKRNRELVDSNSFLRRKYARESV